MDLGLGHHKLLGRVDHRPVQLLQDLARDGLKAPDPGYAIVVKLYPVGFLDIGRIDLEDIPPDAEAGPLEDGVVALILEGNQAALDLVHIDLVAHGEAKGHLAHRVRGRKAVDAGHGGHDDDILPLHEAPGGRKPHPVDLLVDRGVLLDIEVPGGHVGLGLVVVIIGDKVLHGVFWEKVPEFPVELGREGLVVGDDEGGLLGGLDHLGHGKGLARAGDPLEGLEGPARADALG